MGNRFDITLNHEDEVLANELIDVSITEIQRIEALFTTFSEKSVTNQINQNAGIKAIEVPTEFLELVKRSIKISELTQGAFDISYGGLDKSLWNFDKKMMALPSEEMAKKSVELINFRNIEVNDLNSSIFLKKKGIRIGFGGIAKGYAADKAKALMIKKGVEGGIINASGDLSTWGQQPNGKPWTVGIADPHSKLPFSYINISDFSVATSGNYEKFVTINGKRYAHTIDPKTGLPVHGIKSVTVICKSAELADALATPITVMGVQVGLNLINQLNGVGCLIIDENNKIFASKNIKLN